jgi:hypothetical protein
MSNTGICWWRWCMMVYDGRSVSDGCQMVYDGVRWLYREGLSDGVWWCMMVEVYQMVVRWCTMV